MAGLLVGFVATGALGQAPSGRGSGPATDEAVAGAVAAPEGQQGGSAVRRFADPYSAYEAGAFDQALEGFTDRQVERPEDPGVLLNLGSAHYKMRDFEAAERAFSQAAAAGEPAVRGQALYNLGNTAYRQGRLDEAVEMYRAALEVDPDDQDAKFNLEFVRDEIRRRHEEAKKRQEEQQQQQGGEDQQQQQSGEEQEQQDGQEGEDQQQAGQQGQEQQSDPQAGDQEGPDQDGDGLTDRTEREGENPTDPENPDTDGDGLTDGQEDADRDGRVDPGETDPNRADSDGDGTPDGQEPGQEGAQGAAHPQEADPGTMTEEEAERYLQALTEGRPSPEHRLPRGRRAEPEKDW